MPSMLDRRSALDPQRESHMLREAAEAYTRRVRAALGENLTSVVLFGSVARAEAGPDSDIDLLIVAEAFPPGRFARLALLEGIDREFEPELERLRALGLQPRLARILKTRQEAARLVPLYLDMVEDARLLYDRDGFFASVLARLRASMTRLGSERRQRGTVRYWILKPDLKPGEVFEL